MSRGNFLFHLLVLGYAGAYTLRPGLPRDAGWISKQLFSAKMNPQFVDPSRFVVAEEGRTDQTIGCGQIRPLGEDADELASVFVLEEYRGQGIGKAIVASLVARKRASQYTRELFLLTLSGTRGFYSSSG